MGGGLRDQLQQDNEREAPPLNKEVQTIHRPGGGESTYLTTGKASPAPGVRGLTKGILTLGTTPRSTLTL